jgi:hypothetical protein
MSYWYVEPAVRALVERIFTHVDAPPPVTRERSGDHLQHQLPPGR